MKFTLHEAAEALGLEVESDAAVSGWSVDSRTLQPGDLFFALRGPNHDGHEFLAEVFRKGAVAAVVDRDAEAAGVLLRAGGSLKALQALGARARQKWSGDVVAVTGSAGKTTTKDIITDMLSEGGPATKTQGNLNNHVGLPLSLLRMNEAARVAVLEIGMNHAGEIRELANLAQPHVGVVTNVGYAHMENFDSIEGIAAAKRELIESLPESGTAVLNADDPRVAAFESAHTGRTVLYGQSASADIRAEDVEESPDGVRFRVGAMRFESALTGRHSVSNLLAGIAVAGLYGIPPEHLAERVRSFRPGKMRGGRFQHRGVLVYDDCYNSNPEAARAMLDVLAGTPARRRIAVLGEMLELGRWAEPLHREVGGYAAGRGIDVLVGIRGSACYMLEAFAGAAFFFEDPAEAGRRTRSIAQPGDAILFKGSRGVHVERALEQFLSSPSENAGGRS